MGPSKQSFNHQFVYGLCTFRDSLVGGNRFLGGSSFAHPTFPHRAQAALLVRQPKLKYSLIWQMRSYTETYHRIIEC